MYLLTGTGYLVEPNIQGNNTPSQVAGYYLLFRTPYLHFGNSLRDVLHKPLMYGLRLCIAP